MIKTILPPARTRGPKSYMLFAYFIRRNNDNYAAGIRCQVIKNPISFQWTFLHRLLFVPKILYHSYVLHWYLQPSANYYILQQLCLNLLAR